VDCGERKDKCEISAAEHVATGEKENDELMKRKRESGKKGILFKRVTRRYNKRDRI
jgi:hypothetical protein